MGDKDRLHIALVVCGKMGTALVHGWLNANIASQIDILDPGGLPEELTGNKHVGHFNDTDTFSKTLDQADAIILAVKPQIMATVCEELAPHIHKNAFILSIAAGQAIVNFERYFGTDMPIVRTMPNTPAAIGKGMSTAIANTRVTETQKHHADNLLSTVGAVEWVSDENLMDAITAVAGSGPAYVFMLIEAMARAGEKAGLSSDLAMSLARQTVIGGAALAETQIDISAEQLRKNVTSPGGTTEAALKVLMNDDAIFRLFEDAINAAAKRGKDLSR